MITLKAKSIEEARAALARVEESGSKSEKVRVKAMVYAKYPELCKKSSMKKVGRY